MAEAMTVETVLEADLQMRGYWTRLRFPLRTTKGAWSDVDLLAYSPESKELVVAESKVRGTKTSVFAYTKLSAQRYGSILEYDEIEKGQNYFSFIRHLGSLCVDGVIFNDFRKMVRKITVHLVSNYAIAEDCMAQARQDVAKLVRGHVPKGMEVTVQLETTLDVIARLLVQERESKQGRRYGHPALDLAREINRYMHADIGYAGSHVASDEMKKKFRAVFLSAIDVPGGQSGAVQPGVPPDAIASGPLALRRRRR